MRSVNRWYARIGNFMTVRRGDARLREEIEQHIDFQTQENMRAGLTLPKRSPKSLPAVARTPANPASYSWFNSIGIYGVHIAS